MYRVGFFFFFFSESLIFTTCLLKNKSFVAEYPPLPPNFPINPVSPTSIFAMLCVATSVPIHSLQGKLTLLLLFGVWTIWSIKSFFYPATEEEKKKTLSFSWCVLRLEGKHDVQAVISFASHLSVVCENYSHFVAQCSNRWYLGTVCAERLKSWKVINISSGVLWNKNSEHVACV